MSGGDETRVAGVAVSRPVLVRADQRAVALDDKRQSGQPLAESGAVSAFTKSSSCAAVQHS